MQIMKMVAADWAILAIVLLSALISLKRGFVRELLSLIGWVAALLVARWFCEPLAAVLVDVIEHPSGRIAVAFVLLMISTLIISSLLSHLLCEMVRMTGLSGMDRLLGMVFGVIRGLIIVVVLLALARVLSLNSLWEGSVWVPYFEPLIGWSAEAVQKASAMFLSNQ